VIVLAANDLEAPRVASDILADRLRRAGFTVDLQAMDWASVLARRTQRTGWSVFGVHASGLDLASPMTNSANGFNCTGGPASGFFCEERLPPLFDAFAAAPTRAEQLRIATEIQSVV
jgi:peptide/nickel transport system substrate-binding protein